MNALVGDRVRLTIYDTDGTALTAEGLLAAISSAPGSATTPREPAPWPCLVRISRPDGISHVIPYNALELEFLSAEAAEEPGDETSSITISALEAKVADLDDEAADLTEQLKAAQLRVVEEQARADAAQAALAGRDATIKAYSESKIAAATKKK